MARRKGSLNVAPAKTGQLRKRCFKCGKRKYVSEMKAIKKTYRWYDRKNEFSYFCKDDCNLNNSGNAGEQPDAKSDKRQIDV